MKTPYTHMEFHLGGGLRYGISPALDLRGDLRFVGTASREDSVSALAELHVGVAYNFGGTDEAPAPIAEAPPEPRRRDADRDGILDVDDECPDLAELHNGIDDSDGCPEVDSDRDGLLGTQDQCPAAAEDIDGFADDDGCPDADNDNDGRPDVMDQCPEKAENLNGFVDEDGCPDEVPLKLQEFTGSIEGIKFKTGSARILRKTRKTLDAAYKVLSDNPSVRIEVSGHTDNVGNEQNNRSLSRKRADYVKWYLVDKGINADRIETVGHGPDMPLQSNKTSVGRQVNRRIEFRLLPGASSVAAPSAGPAPAAPAKPVVKP